MKWTTHDGTYWWSSQATKKAHTSRRTLQILKEQKQLNYMFKLIETNNALLLLELSTPVLFVSKRLDFLNPKAYF